MGGAVGLLPIVLAILVVVVVVVAFAMRGARRQADRVQAHVDDPDSDTLRYHVPEGQDYVAVAALLRQEGFEAMTELAQGRQDVLVVCPRGADRDRERIREVIASAPLNLDDDPSGDRPVRFADES